MINLKLIRRKSLRLLNSHQDYLIECGRAYLEIIGRCEAFAGETSSERRLISDMAKTYEKHERSLHGLTKNERHRIHAEVASRLVLKEEEGKAR